MKHIPFAGQKVSRLPFALANCVLASVPAFSQAQPVELGASASLNQVDIKSHYANAVGTSDAASQGVVRAERLTDLPLLRPGEVLETVPGMVVTQHSGDGKANQYFLRGYNLDHGTDFATTINAVPVNMPTHAHGQGYSDLNHLIPELVDIIEYRKGPYYAENGDFSSAGSTSIFYKDKLKRGFADLTVGSFGYRRTLVGNSGELNSSQSVEGTGVRWLGALEFLQNQGPWSSPEGMRKNNAVLRLSDGNKANGWSLDGNLYQAHWNSTDQVPLELIQSGQLGLYSALDPTDGGQSGRFSLSGEWHQHNTDGYAKVQAYAQHSRLQLWSNFTFFDLRPNTGDQFEQRESRNLLGGYVVKGWNHPLWGQDAVTELGLQVRHDNIRVGLQNTQSRQAFQTLRDDRVRETLISAYVQNTTAWTPWLRTLAGLRTDFIRMSMDAGTTPQNSGSASASKVSPKLSLILGPWNRTELFINRGNGFHSNDARGVIDKIDPTTGTAAVAVPALVGSRGTEVGVRSEAIDGLQSSLAVWRLDSASELVYSADSAIGSTSPNGASNRYGLEWNNHMAVNRWLLLDADLAWTHARYAVNNDNGDVGNHIPNAVGKVALFGATVHNLGPWSVGAVVRYVGAYPLSQDGVLVGPSAIVANFRAQRDISRDVTIKFDLLNAFDRKYFDIAYQQDYRASPTSAIVPSGVTVHPGEPRQLRVTLQLRF
jgi:hypothetical protein